MGALYYKKARAAVVIYDITEAHSLDRAKEWILELNENADADILVALVGNKVDLIEQRQIEKIVNLFFWLVILLELSSYYDRSLKNMPIRMDSYTTNAQQRLEIMLRPCLSMLWKKFLKRGK